MKRKAYEPFSLQFEELKVPKSLEQYLVSMAVPRWVANSGYSSMQIWFDLFVEHMDQLGYTVVSKQSSGAKNCCIVDGHPSSPLKCTAVLSSTSSIKSKSNTGVA